MGLDELNDGVDTKNPWQTLYTRTVYRTPWIEFFEDDAKSPNGQDAKYSYVDGGGYVTVVVIDNNGYIYLMGQYRYPLKEFTWEVVQGGIDRGESPLDAVKREIKEEAGVVAKSHELIFSFLPSPGLRSDKGHVFLVRDIVEESEQHLDASEKIEVKKVPFKESLEMVKRGEISDLASCFAIQTVAMKLGYLVTPNN